MKVRSRFTMPALAVIGLLSLAACGDRSRESEDATNPTTSSTASGRLAGGASATANTVQSAPGKAVLEDSHRATPTEASQASSATVTTGLPAQTSPAIRRPTVVNPWLSTTIDRLSTFALDVDTGSYTIARRSLETDRLPGPDTVRPEEFVNYFEQGYTRPARDGFAVEVDGAPNPFATRPGARILRVGVVTRSPEAAERKPANLTIVIDVSGSMEAADKLPLVKSALAQLVGQLRADDSVAVVVYGSTARTVLEPTPATQRATILAAIDGLHTEGSTNLEAGLLTGYDVARGSARPGAINRVILLSDGVANVGSTAAEPILATVKGEAASGIQLATIGFGLGEYNDSLMERLADQGDGFYAYVDDAVEARRLFVDHATSTLQTFAQDAKVQVDFDPAKVSAYRLIGFENRAIADGSFRDDSVDAGEIGAGHAVTALYELVLTDPTGQLGSVKLRWANPDTGVVTETETAIRATDLAATFDAAKVRLRNAATVAAFAEALRGGGGDVTWASMDDIVITAQRLATQLDDPAVTEFARLAAKAAALR